MACQAFVLSAALSPIRDVNKLSKNATLEHAWDWLCFCLCYRLLRDPPPAESIWITSRLLLGFPWPATRAAASEPAVFCFDHCLHCKITQPPAALYPIRRASVRSDAFWLHREDSSVVDT